VPPTHQTEGGVSQMTILQGPVSSATRGGTLSPWFSIAIGSLVLVTLWIRYAKSEKKAEVPRGNLVGITVVCLVFIIFGVWELLR
jgi:hypothetical protein